MVALTRWPGRVEEGWSSEAVKSELASRFAGWTGYVTGLIDAVPDDALYRWGLFARAPLTQWIKGRRASLGDAAHPMLSYLGQGACRGSPIWAVTVYKHLIPMSCEIIRRPMKTRLKFSNMIL
jgi:2-polyprenyl-6-methoxyphenol hydroxylase-like FAD-dependent oxidoreductase